MLPRNDTLETLDPFEGPQGRLFDRLRMTRLRFASGFRFSLFPLACSLFPNPYFSHRDSQCRNSSQACIERLGLVRMSSAVSVIAVETFMNWS